MGGRVAYALEMADLTNAQIAAAFDELGDLYELDGAVSYRVIAYRNAARAVRESSVSVATMTREGRVTDVPGIGKTLEEKLRALDETGEIPAAVKLRAKFPSGLIAVMHLPGFGPKRARRLYDELGVDSLDSLRAAAEAGQIAGLRGFGKKVEENLKQVLADHEDGGGPAPRVLLSRAIPVAEQIVGVLRGHPASDRVEVAGSLRRRADSVKDLDIIATASDPKALASTLGDLDIVESVQQSGDAGARVTLHTGMKVDLKVVEPDQFGNVLQHFTGSKAHNVALRESVVRRGLHVSEYGILDDATGETTRCATEEEVYEKLGLAWIPPELREGRGELEAALPTGPGLPELVDDRGPQGRPAHAHDRLRRPPDRRGDGDRGARARARVHRHHRPLGLARVRQRRLPRPAARADRGDPGAELQARGDRAADRDGEQHPHRRLARLRRRPARAARLGDRLASTRRSRWTRRR